MALPRYFRKKNLTPALTALPILFSVGVAQAQVGPGIGNIDCGEAEYFRPFAFVDHNYGGDPHGQNVTAMIRGYFMTVYAPDSGLGPGRIGIYDVSNPRSPTEVQYYSGGGTNDFREQHSLPIGIVGGKHYIAFQTRSGIQFWDFTDPLSAFEASSISLPGVTGGDYENVSWQASWQGNYLYVTGGNQGIYVIDASDPLNPDLLNQVSTSATGGFRVGPLFALGDLLVISNMDQNGSYAVLDISDPEDPALLDQLGNAPRMYAIAVGPNHRFYTAGRDGNFLIHSFEDPTNITEVKNELVGQDQLYAAVQDNFVFLGRQNNVVKVDVTDEQSPGVVGEGTLGRDNPDHGQVTPMGNLIYIGNDHGTGSAFFCHQMGQDTIPLSPDTFYPEDAATSVPTEARVSIVFSDFVNLETVSPSTVTIRAVDGEPLEGIYTYQFNHLSFSPAVPFAADTTYEVSIPAAGVTDVMGNGLSEDVVVRFSTGSMVTIPDPEPPGTGGAQTVGSGGSGGEPTATTGGFVAPTGGAGGTVAASTVGAASTTGGATGTGGATSTAGGAGGGFVAPTGGATGTGGTTSTGAVVATGGAPTSPDSSSGPKSYDSGGGCMLDQNGDSGNRTLAFALLGAFIALARRQRRRL